MSDTTYSIITALLMICASSYAQNPVTTDKSTSAATPPTAATQPIEPAKVDQNIRKNQKPQRKPLVVMKQADILGKVFIIDDEKDTQNSPAQRIMIKLANKKEDDAIYETGTDDEGVFKIPNLDKGEYHLIVGLLTLDLNVMDADPQAAVKMNIPKNIMVFIPNSMFKKAKAKYAPPAKAEEKTMIHSSRTINGHQ
jgi:hypothetical protein